MANINNIPSIQDKVHIQSVQPVNKTTQPKQRPVSPATKGDRVDLSDTAKQMQSAKKMIQQMPDVDEEKVARIKAQLKSGEYKVDAEKIATRMLEESFTIS